jgi:hypothetical protein
VGGKNHLQKSWTKILAETLASYKLLAQCPRFAVDSVIVDLCGYEHNSVSPDPYLLSSLLTTHASTQPPRTPAEAYLPPSLLAPSFVDTTNLPIAKFINPCRERNI